MSNVSNTASTLDPRVSVAAFGFIDEKPAKARTRKTSSAPKKAEYSFSYDEELKRLIEQRIIQMVTGR